MPQCSHEFSRRFSLSSFVRNLHPFRPHHSFPILISFYILIFRAQLIGFSFGWCRCRLRWQFVWTRARGSCVHFLTTSSRLRLSGRRSEPCRMIVEMIELEILAAMGCSSVGLAPSACHDWRLREFPPTDLPSSQRCGAEPFAWFRVNNPSHVGVRADATSWRP